MLNTVN